MSDGAMDILVEEVITKLPRTGSPEMTVKEAAVLMRDEKVGSLIIIEAENLEAAKAWTANDPYAKAGVYAHYDVRPWKVTFNPSGAAL